MSDILGTRRSIRCSDGKTRTGAVVYINPYRTFATMEFEGKGGKWREAFFFTDPARYCKAVDDKPAAMHQSYTPEEDAEILNMTNSRITAKKLGRTESAVDARKMVLVRAEKLKARRKYTAEEDREVLKHQTAEQTAKILGRTYKSVYERRQSLRKKHARHDRRDAI